ncbi:MAG: HPr family phosphocarrier protein [Mycoplasmataceae bacterium]|nr:HPr family phosphocarrier protein [Mycoplasmataceae bacterium]
MTSFTAKIIDPVGLHARPASITVSVASKFKSDIKIISGGKSGNLKSIMNIMAIGVKGGQEIVIEATGDDEKEAIQAIQDEMKKNNLI